MHVFCYASVFMQFLNYSFNFGLLSGYTISWNINEFETDHSTTLKPYETSYLHENHCSGIPIVNNASENVTMDLFCITVDVG